MPAHQLLLLGGGGAGGIGGGARLAQAGFERADLAGGDEFVGGQAPAFVQQALGFGGGGLGFGRLGTHPRQCVAGDGIVELHQHLARLDAVAGVHLHLAHQAVHARRQAGGAVGGQRAGELELFAEVGGLGLHHAHGHGGQGRQGGDRQQCRHQPGCPEALIAAHAFSPIHDTASLPTAQAPAM